MRTPALEMKYSDIELADQLCYCGQQVNQAAISGNMAHFNKWIDKHDEILTKIRERSVKRLAERQKELAERQKEHDVFMNQIQIDKAAKIEAEEVIKKLNSYKHCLSIVK